MKSELIKPIPKYMLIKIRRQDKKECPDQKGLRMYSYLTSIRKELVKITVAVKGAQRLAHTKLVKMTAATKSHRKAWYCKQVAAHGIKSDKCLVRDMEYICFGYGYRVGFYAEGADKRKKWFEDGKWYSVDTKYYNPWTTLINFDYAAKFPEYKYSAYKHFRGKCIIEYLKLYGKYPQVEFLMKLGLHKLYDSVTVLKRIVKDKKFCKWLIANSDEIKSERCYVGTILQAYKTGKPIKQIQSFSECRKKLNSDNGLRPLKELFGDKLEQLFSYLEAQDSTPNSYLDYLKACNYLGLDMALPKNRFPNNFKHWHDIRIDEYHSAKAMADEKERAELYAKFAVVTEKYLSLQKQGKNGFAIILAASPAELIREGEILGHCVGKMGYDQKFAREETLIFFVRNTADIDSPFVTVEYSPKSKKVLQSYGQGHSKPDDTVAHFINKIWLPHAARVTRRIHGALSNKAS